MLFQLRSQKHIAEGFIKFALLRALPAARSLHLPTTVLQFYLIATAIHGANGETVKSCHYTLDEEMTVDVSETSCPAGIRLSPSNNSECQVWMWQASDSDSKQVGFETERTPLSLSFNISDMPAEAKQVVIACRSYSHQTLGPVTFVITEEG